MSRGRGTPGAGGPDVRTGAGPVLLAAAVAAGATALVRRATDGWVQQSPDRWARTNHRGEQITLLEGPAVAAGLAGGTVVGCAAAGLGPRRTAGALLALLGAAGFGLHDDLSEDARRNRKGLRGHLGALLHGEVTTGGLKVLGISGSALLGAALLLPRGADRGRAAHLLEVLEAGALVAGTANLVNLLDLRPGRALKATGLAAVGALGGNGGPAAGAVLGAAVAAAPGDLGERDMLGDCGANALGAVVGTAAVLGAPRPARAAMLAAVVGLTLASEKVSFTAVIERTPVLRALDGWGRR